MKLDHKLIKSTQDGNFMLAFNADIQLRQTDITNTKRYIMNYVLFKQITPLLLIY